MLTLKTSDQLRTMRNVKSYRCCPTSTGPPMWAADLGRICLEELLRWNRELRRQWLAAAWQNRCCCR
ncbi:MAG: hypothetical protein HY790_04195 [Deltaproteobacteria bacterium]|nr:hypothetical protein [Deltaproteobacteria bacterium]MBI4795030.1 hypothetical protein [Deltaproteobacteria bacterium]